VVLLVLGPGTSAATTSYGVEVDDDVDEEEEEEVVEDMSVEIGGGYKSGEGGPAGKEQGQKGRR